MGFFNVLQLIILGILLGSEMAELGRPTKYKEEYNEQAYKLCLLGATDAKLANFFDIAESTLYEWKLEYPDFSESLKKGKLIADAEIAEGLYNRAKGAVINTQQAIKLKRVEYEQGKRMLEEERVEVVDLMQEVPPDTAASIFWLKNRQPEVWRDKQGDGLLPSAKELIEIEIKKLELEKIRREVNPPKVDAPDGDYKVVLKPDEVIPSEPVL